jgi:hypothetical protein
VRPDEYREALRLLPDPEAFLLAESGLPGPRGNLELAAVVADEADSALIMRLLDAAPPDVAPTGTPHEFLAFCGAVSLGRLLAEEGAGAFLGDRPVLVRLRALASDPRWRVREGVAMALQRWGAVDMDGLVAAMEEWADGTYLEQRAAAAALCEPALLRRPEHVRRTLAVLDRLTDHVAEAADRKDEGFRVLRRGLAYCWSVAIVADLESGRPAFARWTATGDRDVRWMLAQNLKKSRLLRADPGWVAAQTERLLKGTPAG